MDPKSTLEDPEKKQHSDMHNSNHKNDIGSRGARSFFFLDPILPALLPVHLAHGVVAPRGTL